MEEMCCHNQTLKCIALHHTLNTIVGGISDNDECNSSRRRYACLVMVVGDATPVIKLTITLEVIFSRENVVGILPTRMILQL